MMEAVPLTLAGDVSSATAARQDPPSAYYADLLLSTCTGPHHAQGATMETLALRRHET